MKEELTFQTRREFLRRMVLGGALSWTVPAFLGNTFAALHAEAAAKEIQALDGHDSTILVILQMAGGNDGLNTVVPFADDHYRRARPRLALGDEKILRLSDSLGLHPALTGLKDLYDAGQLSVIQGVGYPNPNRSHFRSTEIWQTATASNSFERYGWVGRYFDNACAGADPTVGISIGRQMPQSFASKLSKGVSLENPQNFRFMAGKHPSTDDAERTEMSFRKLNEGDALNSGATVEAIGGKIAHSGSVLDFVERTALDAQLSSDTIRAIAARGQNSGSYPGSQLANSLKLVARLIGGGMTTRVYYVSQGGYDTHTNQAPAQERLLKDLGDSIKAFVNDLKEQGNARRVLLMTFSEFGRRVTENANGGTDHGAAAPMFVIGEQVAAGLQGKYPSLAPEDLFNGDLKHTVDFRSVYATILERWLKTPSVPILGSAFPHLELLKS